MKAMRLKRLGEGERFELFDKPDVDPRPGQVAIQVHAASVNVVDTKGWEVEPNVRIGARHLLGFSTIVAKNDPLRSAIPPLELSRYRGNTDTSGR